MSPNYDLFRTLQHYWIDPEWLGKRMLFLSGPRQVGKTTLVQNTLCRDTRGYFNWDAKRVRQQYQRDPDFFAGSGAEWICFDEIHKRPKWKDILKGIYDSHKDRFRFVVTGSARLETFRKSGDSLVGRYFHTHLFPLNLPDFEKADFDFPKQSLDLIERAADTPGGDVLENLLLFGGFPEPFFAGRETFWKRWSLNHRDLILREDLRDLSKIVEFDKMEHLLTMLIPAVGDPTSYRNLAVDLETTHGSIRRWLEMLYKIHLVFPVPPYSKKIRRAYKQEKKWYFTDWVIAGENRFENFIAASLQRAAALYTDRFGEEMTLHFIRTHDGTETDFLLCRDKAPWLLVEAKEGSPVASKADHRFSRELGIPCVIATRKPNIFRRIESRDGGRLYAISWNKLGVLLP